VREDRNIRVFLLDDHEVVRRGIRGLLAAEPGIEVVGEADGAAEAMAHVPAAHPDVAVLDVRLPDGSGVEVCREIRSHDPSVKCLMLTSFADDEAVFDAVMAGAAGYAPKVIRGEDLIRAVRDVAAGESLLDPAATAKVLERLHGGGRRSCGPERPAEGPADRVTDRLTEQEWRIVDLIGEGLTNRQIAERARLSEKAVRKAVSSLLAKLGMERWTQAEEYAARARPSQAGGRRG
jgi:DNA-binding NarL/FixJ family response regulator